MARVWRDVLPELPSPSVPTPKRQSACKARWAQMPAAKMPREEFWRRLCVRIGNSPFLMGETTDWKATFDWAIRPDSFMKLWEGHYQSQPRRPQRVDVTDPARFGF